MNNIYYQALLFAALIPKSLFCIDADIFKEMLTLSTAVQAQESLSEEKKVISEHECIAARCSAQQKAFERIRKAAYYVAVDEQTIAQSIYQLQKCAQYSCPIK